MFLQPMATVLVYFFVFQMGFKSVPPVPDYPYVLWLIPGIVPWFYFSEVLNMGTGCLQEYNYLVKKGGVPGGNPSGHQNDFLHDGTWHFCNHHDPGIFLLRLFTKGKLGADPVLFLCKLHAVFSHCVFYQCHSCVFQGYGSDHRDLPAVWDVDGADYVGAGDVSVNSLLAAGSA